MMEDVKIEQFKGLVKKIALSEKEVADLRLSVSEFIKLKPIRHVRMEGTAGRIGQRSWIPTLFSIQPMPIALAIILFVTVGGGVSLAAENALPGDALYPVKVSVNEEVRARLSTSAEARTDWEIKRLERRLSEAATVVARGEVKDEVRAQIEENFARQADKVEARIAELEEKGNIVAAAELSSNSEAVLNVHERILAKLSGEALVMNTAADAESSTSLMFSAPADEAKSKKGDRNASKAKSSEKLLARVRESRDTALLLREKAEDRVTLESSAEGRLKAAENKLAEVRKFLERNESGLDLDAKQEIDGKLSVSAQLVLDGKAKMSAKAYKEAFSLFLMAHRHAQEAKLMISSSQSSMNSGASINISLDREAINGKVKIESDEKSKAHSVKDEIIVNPDGGTSSVEVNPDIKVKIGL